MLAQRNRKFIEARSINYQRRTFRDRNREARSISTRKFSMIRETRIVEKSGESTIKERHASSLPFSPNDKFVCSAMRKGGDRSSCRGVCPEGRMERGEERGKRQRPVVRHSWLRHGGNPPRRTLRTSLKLFGVSKLASVSLRLPRAPLAVKRETKELLQFRRYACRISNVSANRGTRLRIRME